MFMHVLAAPIPVQKQCHVYISGGSEMITHKTFFLHDSYLKDCFELTVRASVLEALFGIYVLLLMVPAHE